MNELLKAMHFRHACKVFDESKVIKEEDFADILESARLSPSSMGMEPTRILVVRDKQLRLKLREACYGQLQITSCSELVILKSLSADMHYKSDYVKRISSRRCSNENEINSWLNRYKIFLDNIASYGISLDSWVAKQSYIIASSMMTMAAFLGIDSCPIEGFSKKEVNNVLQIDMNKENVNLILAFGYRVNPQSKRYRIDITDMVEYI